MSRTITDRTKKGIRPEKIDYFKTNKKAVMIEGEVFLTVTLASLFLKVNKNTIIYRLKSKSDKFKNWRYLDKNNPIDKNMIIYELRELEKVEKMSEESPWI